MRRVNVSEPTFTYDGDDPEGYRAGLFRPGPDFGAVHTGASFYELPPGQSACPYHYESAEEEWLMVLAGRPTLRDPNGDHELAPWDVVYFPPGPEGAHKVTNASGETVRFMMWSDRHDTAVCVYPDSDKLGVWVVGQDEASGRFRRTARLEYYDGEV